VGDRSGSTQTPCSGACFYIGVHLLASHATSSKACFYHFYPPHCCSQPLSLTRSTCSIHFKNFRLSYFILHKLCASLPHSIHPVFHTYFVNTSFPWHLACVFHQSWYRKSSLHKPPLADLFHTTPSHPNWHCWHEASSSLHQRLPVLHSPTMWY